MATPFTLGGRATSPENKPGEVARFVPTVNADDPQTIEFLACHRIALAELPPRRLRALLQAANSVPTAVLNLAGDYALCKPLGLTEKQFLRLREAATMTLDPKLMDRAITTGTSAILLNSPGYPTNLLPLDDAPPLLFVRGNLDAIDRFGIAIVGTRRSSAYGDEQAARFAGMFAQNQLTVISGGAAGIDTAAHYGAIRAGGRTIAVLGCGLDIVYPASNRDLFALILSGQHGALVSEFPLGTRPEPWRFPTRNRIIAGLARASLLIETPEDSGALGTAKCSTEYGRDVYVVPGPVDSGRSRGGHRLIMDGAILADSPEEMLTSLGVVLQAQEEGDIPIDLFTVAPQSAPPMDRPKAAVKKTDSPAPVQQPVPDLPPDQLEFFSALSNTPRPFDEVAQSAGLSAAQANVAATLLEMKSLIHRHPGNLFSKRQ